MVYRIYVEKKDGLALEADALCSDIRALLGISGVCCVHLLNRYDVENISPDDMSRAVRTVLSEPQLDSVYEKMPYNRLSHFAVEYLPGQFDMRASSAEQCIQLMCCGERPTVRTARVYAFEGELSTDELNAIKRHVVNPVECREAECDDEKIPSSLALSCEIPHSVPVLDGFCDMDDDGIRVFISSYGLAMDEGDLKMTRDHFRAEGREPTLTEIKMIDTYWSDHCRHTTFLTEIDGVSISDPAVADAYAKYTDIRRELGRTKPETLMDIGTIAARYLKSKGKLDRLDESDEINACTVKIKVNMDGVDEDWLLLFKNETHNHPTEIEPFGGAATCIGGAIRDPLSGRAYVYAAMRVTGASDPTRPLADTLPGKIPQRKLVTSAAAGYSSYGNQIGLATGQVDELYHDGYVAKRLEIGAVLGAAPARNVRRESPLPGDIVLLLGGRTGRDGCGGATGSSKSHDSSSLSTCGAEVQKGNAPEERKLQRLFRDPRVTAMIKRCNDFGAGGVSVAVGELADGLDINLDAVTKKYEGLDGTELAISESQERMAVVVAADDVERFRTLADGENLEATPVATVNGDARLRMSWNGVNIVDLPRSFLDSNGAPKHITVDAAAARDITKKVPDGDFTTAMLTTAADLNVCSKRGLSERFDSTIGAGTVLMPFGGVRQLTPPQVMVHKLPVTNGQTDTCSFMAWGFNPVLSEASPFHGAYLAVIESVSKLIAGGAAFNDVYLSFQEYFEKPLRDPKRWGKPFSALLGALRAQLELGVAAIGGKDSMSGSFEKIDVPPTLVSFAVTTGKISDVISPEFKSAGHKIVLIQPRCGTDRLPVAASLIATFAAVTKNIRSGRILSAVTPGFGGVAEALMKMSFGNRIGVDVSEDIDNDTLLGYSYGGFVCELSGNNKNDADTVAIASCEEYNVIVIGVTNTDGSLRRGVSCVGADELLGTWEGRLENVYSCNIKQKERAIPTLDYTPAKKPAPVRPLTHTPRPRVLIPVFPGTNCEYDTSRALAAAGCEPRIFVINNLTPAGVAESVSAFAYAAAESEIIFIPGGFSGGDEPDGSGKFITAFFRSSAVKEEVNRLLSYRGGLMCGICNGFQALIKLGLVPYGEIRDAGPDAPTLTYNTVGRHQSRLVRTRVASTLSPWLSEMKVGDIITVPISHGEGRFYASDECVRALASSGQIATQYVDDNGMPSCDIHFNPNDSAFAVEGITSPDGRVFGKMGHSERIGVGLYLNVPGNYDMGLFRSAVRYFK